MIRLRTALVVLTALAAAMGCDHSTAPVAPPPSPPPPPPPPPPPAARGRAKGTARPTVDTTLVRQLLAQRPVPSDKIVLQLASPLKPETRYMVRVQGATSLVGRKGGGDIAFTTPKPTPPDTTRRARPAGPADTTRRAPGKPPADTTHKPRTP